MFLALHPRLAAISVSTAFSSSSSVSTFATRLQPVAGGHGAAGDCQRGGGTGSDEEAALPLVRFLGCILRLSRPASLSRSPRNSIVAWHHLIYSAWYAFATVDGKRHVAEVDGALETRLEPDIEPLGDFGMYTLQFVRQEKEKERSMRRVMCADVRSVQVQSRHWYGIHVEQILLCEVTRVNCR
jgi:hypothetical protein